MEFTLKKKSWHLWLANFGSKRIGHYDLKYGTDICHYLRQMMWGTITLFAAAFGVALLTAWVGVSFYNIFLLIVGRTIEVWGPTVALIIVLSSIIMTSVFVYVGMKWKTYRDKHPKPVKEPGIVKLSYRKFKDKTCFRINFKDDTND